MIAGRYRLESEVGSGGFGVVWLARDVASDHPVAIKFLKGRAHDDARRFEREASALARVVHPNTVHLVAYGAGTQSYIVTEYVDGQTLDAWARSREVGRAQAVDIVLQIAAALAAAHALGIIHRDLKPSNVMIQPGADGRPFVKVLDFGLAKMLGEKAWDLTSTGEIVGTPGFMSPEQLSGKRTIGPPADLYCVGLLLFELLTGAPPFTGTTALEVCMKHLTDEPPALPPSVDRRLRGLVAQLLRKDPNTRPTLDQLVAQLRDVRSGSTTREAPADPGVSRRLTVGLVVAAVAGLVAIVAALAVGPKEPAAAPPGHVPDRVSRPGLVRGGTPPPVATSVPPSSCPGRRPFPAGIRHIERTENLRNYSIAVQVPPNYDPRRRYPVVLLFSDGFQRPEEALVALDPQSFAEYVVIAPLDDSKTEQWKRPSTIDEAIEQVEWVGDTLCLDRTRIFALGTGAGGLAAERMMCEYPAVVAIASTSHRMNDHDPRCEPKEPKPYLFIASTRDPFEPVDGSADCLGGKKWSLPQNVTWLQSIYGCQGPEKEVSTTKTSRCVTWDCRTAFISCEVEGGRPWPNDPRVTTRTTTEVVVHALSGMEIGCRSEPAEFDYSTPIRDFFAKAHDE